MQSVLCFVLEEFVNSKMAENPYISRYFLFFSIKMRILQEINL